jgi:uncharacterized protein
MIKRILLCGGTGFVGSHLSEAFRSKNYEVHILSRHPNNENQFYWNPGKNEMDEKAINEVDCIINLAGANIGTKRWTSKRKKEILDSRVKSNELLFEKLKGAQHRVKLFISPSAVGYYGDSGERWMDENEKAGTDFLADVCRQWEDAVRKMETLNMRVVILRTGVILDKKEGALPVMALPVKLFAGTPVGNGRQFISWIHIDDIVKLYEKIIEDETLRGIYNATSSNPVSNKAFTCSLAKALHRPFWNIAVPASILKLILGEKGEIVTKGQRVSNKKIRSTGFQFQYDDIETAMRAIYRS